MIGSTCRLEPPNIAIITDLNMNITIHTNQSLCPIKINLFLFAGDEINRTKRPLCGAVPYCALIHR